MFKTKKMESLYRDWSAKGIAPLKVSKGNKKLKETKRTAFLIWNLPAVKTCPYATPLCKKICYALKAERVYKSARNSRALHFAQSMCDDFTERMIWTIMKRLKRTKKGQRLVVRIHESGEFYSPAYVAKWFKVMDFFKGELVTFVAYTKSFPYFDGVKLPSNFMLNASIMEDTPEWALEMIKRNGWRTYRCVMTEADMKAWLELQDRHECRCAGCGSCMSCWSASKKHIAVIAH